jgi:hypothetical protein
MVPKERDERGFVSVQVAGSKFQVAGYRLQDLIIYPVTWNLETQIDSPPLIRA